VVIQCNKIKDVASGIPLYYTFEEIKKSPQDQYMKNAYKFLLTALNIIRANHRKILPGSGVV